MKAGKPDDPVSAPPPASLAGRLGHAARERLPALGGGDWRLGAAVAALLWAGPLLTIAGAHLLAGSERSAARRLEAELAPRMAARQAAEAARRELAPTFGRSSASATLEALARALPAEATLVRAERMPAGPVEIHVSTPDPDKLRTALRRAPEFGRMRDAGQRGGDGAMITSLRGDVQ